MTLTEKKQVAAIFVISLLVAAVILIAVPYYKTMKRYNKEIDNHVKEIKTLRQQAANKPALQKDLDRIEAAIDDSNLFMKEDNPKAAGLALLAILNQLIQDNKGEVTISKIGRPLKSSQQKAVSVTATFSIANSDFINLLKEISAHRPAMNVTKVRIAPEQKSKAIKDETTGKRKQVQFQTGRLLVSMDLEGFYIATPVPEEVPKR